MRESQIQSKIGTWLRKEGYMVMKIMSASVPGWPDLVCISPLGHHIYFEIKTDTGRLSPIQKIVHKKLRLYECEVHTVTSLEEVKEIMEDG